MFLHDAEELDDDLGAGSDHDLSLSSLLGVVDRLEGVIEDGCSSHFEGLLEFFRQGDRGREGTGWRVSLRT